MPFKKLITWVPEIYHSFLPEVFQWEIPEESLCDCFNCTLIANSHEEINEDLSKPFSPDSKCCTFFPRLPNFLIGAILADVDPELAEGKRRIEQLINSHEDIKPEGITPTKAYDHLYDQNTAIDFGSNQDLICPFFVPGKYNCSIWKYREATCAFWFCKHLAGEQGRTMWNNVIEYIKYLQASLMEFSKTRVGITDQNENPENHDYYKACFDSLEAISPEEIAQILENGQEIEDKLKNQLLEVLDMPDYLRLNRDLVSPDDSDYYRIEYIHHLSARGKSLVYEFRLPQFILDGFDGSTQTEEVMQRLLNNYNTKLEPEIILSLYHHGILKATSV